MRRNMHGGGSGENHRLIELQDLRKGYFAILRNRAMDLKQGESCRTEKLCNQNKADKMLVSLYLWPVSGRRISLLRRHCSSSNHLLSPTLALSRASRQMSILLP